MTAGEQRRLAAIMMLDVVGFSAMMAEDESATLAQVLEVRRRIIEPIIARHDGRVVKVMGDGALVEFASVTGAVQCSESIQKSMLSQAGDNPIILRIGINLGEVIVEDDDIYGDGVNVASRIEGLAEPGGIAVSSTVFEQVHQRLSVTFEDGGSHMVKNIPNPVHVYHIRVDGDHLQGGGPGRKSTRKTRPIVLGLIAVVVLAAAGLVIWWQFSDSTRITMDEVVPFDVSNKPSIAVLPFDNLSGDADQSYFSDGIAENLITDLSRVSGLLVIARNTSFSFRDQPIDARGVGTELGVRYVVEGSVQRVGDHVRINANLVDASTGFQVWAGRLDRVSVDLFALQDEITAQIVEALQVELTQEERRLIAKRHTVSLEAYDLYLRAWEEIWRFNDEARRTALNLLDEALKIDSKFALAKSLMATAHTNRSGASLLYGRGSLDYAFELAQEAVALDPDLPQVQSALGIVHMFRREFELAEASYDRAIALDPNYADAYAMRAWNWHYAGKPELALKSFEYAMLLNPRAPFPYLNALAEIHFSLGNCQTALNINTKTLERNPTAQRVRLLNAVCLALLGQIEEAEWEVEELLLLEPDLTISLLPAIVPYRDQATLDRFIKGARLAGLPE